MRFLFKIILLTFSLVFLGYLFLPTSDFPDPPGDAVQSREPADTETPLRRAYFTNFSRQEVIRHYRGQFERFSFVNISLPSLRLNYPPENAQTLIRDQTRSTFLEELVHPFRESLFINGFKPKVAKDDIWYKGENFQQKIIIRYVPSLVWVRLGLAVITLSASLVLLKEWGKSIKELWQKV